MAYTALLSGFAVTGFRSFDDAPQILSDLQKINFLVGCNNSGKSNVLNALQVVCEFSRGPEGRSALQKLLQDPLSKPVGLASSQTSIWIRFPSKANQVFPQFEDWKFNINGRYYSVEAGVNEVLLALASKICVHGFVAIRPGEALKLTEDLLLKNGNLSAGSHELFSQLFNKYSGFRGGGPEGWIQFFLKNIDPSKEVVDLKFVEVPAVRKLIDSGTAFDGTFGEINLIETIAQWESPDVQQLTENQKKFNSLLAFSREVLEDSSVEIRVPYKRNTLHIVKDGKTLPIERLGTGVHQVIMFAAAATVTENSIFAVEEPETNLHPSLQRKLLRYLSEETSNQYFITTHSAHILDAVPAAIFHVSLDAGATRVSKIATGMQRFAAVEDLGYRASDLIQTPIVIWVEGPSDKTYLSAWISSADEQLVEGTHYSLMFYGGKLLSHLEADDSDLNEFISLRRLNRYVAIVIDSDKRNSRGRLRPTKLRVINEVNKSPGFGLAWVTDGKEIENYLDPEPLAAAMAELAVDFSSLPERAGAANARFDDALSFRSISGELKSLATKKVPFARAYVKHSAGRVPSSRHALEQVRSLCALIRKANGIN